MRPLVWFTWFIFFLFVVTCLFVPGCVFGVLSGVALQGVAATKIILAIIVCLYASYEGGRTRIRHVVHGRLRPAGRLCTLTLRANRIALPLNNGCPRIACPIPKNARAPVDGM